MGGIEVGNSGMNGNIYNVTNTINVHVGGELGQKQNYTGQASPQPQYGYLQNSGYLGAEKINGQLSYRSRISQNPMGTNNAKK